ncbi:hypothetical protein, partial [Acinetobacter baumannii]|uniref:hypothetical protein n=1 Tax=Acinetobacter baumannii TaxID=470 RepID=UPI00339083B1
HNVMLSLIVVIEAFEVPCVNDMICVVIYTYVLLLVGLLVLSLFLLSKDFSVIRGRMLLRGG